jgi:outer membrane protein assembly factor BamB
MRNLATLAGVVVLCAALGCAGGPAETEDEADDGGPAEAASWPMFHGRQDMVGVAPGRLPKALTLQWKFQTEGPIKSSPAIELAAGAGSEKVSGTLRLKVPDTFSGSAGRVFVGSNDGHLYALDLADGRKVWAFKTADAVEAAPLVLQGAVYVGSADGFLYALDAATGALRWKYETQDKILGGANWVRSTLRSGSAAAAEDGSPPSTGPYGQGDRTWILVGSYDMSLHCVDAATGKAVWTAETGNYVNGTPAVADGKIVFGGCDGLVRVLAPADGRELLSIQAGGYVAGAVAVAGDRFYAANYDEKLTCARVDTGKTVWEYAGEDAGFYSSPAVGPREVVIGGRDNRVHCLDRETGKPRWTFATRRDVESSPAICGGKVVVGSSDGRLYLLRLADGKELASFEVGRPVTSSPAVAGGWVVVGGDDGAVYAFGPKP